MRLRPILNLTRLHAAGWEALIFVLGPLLVGESFFSAIIFRLWILGIVINSFIFALNNVADLPRDQYDPSRKSSPLVNGDLTYSFALCLACSLPIVMWLIVATGDWPVSAEISFASLLLLGTYLCVFQKTTPRVHPLLLDSLFGVAMAGPIPVGILSTDKTPHLSAWLLTSGFMILCIGLNTFGGNLKDLSSDLNTGFRTTAIVMGVRIATNGSAEFSSGFRLLAYSLGSASSLSLLAASVLSWSSHEAPFNIVQSLLTIFLLGCALISLHRLGRGSRLPHPRGRDPFFVFGLAALLSVSLAFARPAQLGAAITVTLLWEFSFSMYWRKRAKHLGRTDLRVDGRENGNSWT